LFIVFILAIVALRREEARLTQRRLGDYAAAGWFTPEEVTMPATPAGRRVGLQWAAGLPGDRRALMRSFIKDAAAVAAVRQRAINGHDRSEEHTSELQSRENLVCRLLLEKKKK